MPAPKDPMSGLFGLGVDLVEVSRVRRLAARFAVKEAVIKALDARNLALKDIEVENTASGRPLVKVKGLPSLALMVSISHTSRHALAAVVAFKKRT